MFIHLTRHKDKILNEIKFELHSFRCYGNPKLSVPKEIKGVKSSFSVEYIPKKCTCSVHINNYDIWIKHKDYFSKPLEHDDLGAPLEVLANKYLDRTKGKKFIYSDSWGSIVLRNEAWICIRNLKKAVDSGLRYNKIVPRILRQQESIHRFETYELDSSDMSRFYEKLINQCSEVST